MFNLLDNVRKIANDAHANVVEIAQNIAAGLQEEDEPGISGEGQQNHDASNSVQKVKSGASHVIETIDKAAKLLPPTTEDVVFIDLLAKLMGHRADSNPQVRNWLKLYDEWKKDDNFDKFEQLRRVSESLTLQDGISMNKTSNNPEVEQRLNDIDLNDDELKDARIRIAELEEQVQQLAEENDSLMSHQIAANLKSNQHFEKEILKLSEDLDRVQKEAIEYKDELLIKRQALEYSVQQEKALSKKVTELSSEIEEMQSDKNSNQAEVEYRLKDIELNYQEAIAANNTLQDEVKGARDRIAELETQIRTLIEEKNNLVSLQIPDNSEALESVQSENFKLSEDLDYVQKEVTEYKEELSIKRQALEQSLQQEEALKVKVMELAIEIERTNSDKNSLQSEMERQLKEMKSNYQEAVMSSNKVQDQLKNALDRVAELETQTEKLIEDKSTLLSLKVTENSEALNNVQDENRKLSEDLDCVRKELAKSREELLIKQQELRQAVEQEEALKTKIMNLSNEVEALQLDKNSIQSNVEQQLKDIELNYQEAVTTNDNLQDELKNAYDRITELENQTQTLVEDKNTLTSLQAVNNSEALKAVQDENLRLSDDLDCVQKEATEYKRELIINQQKLEHYVQQEEALKTKVVELVNEIERLQLDKNSIQSSVEQQLKSVESDYQEAVIANNSLQDQLKNAHNRVAELETQTGILMEEKNALISLQVPDNSEALESIHSENVKLSDDLNRIQKEAIEYKEDLLINREKLEHSLQQEEALKIKVKELTNEIERMQLNKNSIQADVEQQLRDMGSSYQEAIMANSKLQDEVKSARDRVAELETQIRTLIEEKNNLVSPQVPENSEILESVRSENSKLSEDLDCVQKELTEYKKKLLVGQQALEQSLQQEEELKLRVTELTHLLQKTESNRNSAIEEENRCLKDMESSLQQLQRENETLKRDLHLAHADSYSSKEMTQKLQNHIEILKRELTEKEVEIAEIAAELSTNEHDRHKLGTESSADMEQLRKLLDSSDKEISFITSKNEDLRRNLQQITNQLASEKTVVTKLSNDKDVLSMQLQNIKEDHAQLKADFERLNNSDRSKSSTEISEVQNKFSRLEISMNMAKQALKQIYADEREQRQTFSLLLSIFGFDQQVAETMVQNFEHHNSNNILNKSGPGLIEEFDKFVEKEITVNKIQLSPAPQQPFAMTIDEPLGAPEEVEQSDLKDII
ncbi:hypothetical protein FO519_000595 [Halicephalobus sp. NKZ332]|nr:hypothetical protein FO519_000595 [Halicephalobus sp. NKZ332]